MKTNETDECAVSNSFTFKNLSIFLIYGEDRIKGETFLTLQEAMEQKKLIVHETGRVNEIAIENIFEDEEVYIQSGDIVKGSKQDRVKHFGCVSKKIN